MRRSKVRVTGVKVYKPNPWSSMADATEFALRPSDGKWFARSFYWSGGSKVLPFRWSEVYAAYQLKWLVAAEVNADKVVYLPAEGSC